MTLGDFYLVCDPQELRYFIKRFLNSHSLKSEFSWSTWFQLSARVSKDQCTALIIQDVLEYNYWGCWQQLSKDSNTNVWENLSNTEKIGTVLASSTRTASKDDVASNSWGKVLSKECTKINSKDLCSSNMSHRIKTIEKRTKFNQLQQDFQRHDKRCSRMCHKCSSHRLVWWCGLVQRYKIPATIHIGKMYKGCNYVNGVCSQIKKKNYCKNHNL